MACEANCEANKYTVTELIWLYVDLVVLTGRSFWLDWVALYCYEMFEWRELWHVLLGLLSPAIHTMSRSVAVVVKQHFSSKKIVCPTWP